MEKIEEKEYDHPYAGYVVTFISLLIYSPYANYNIFIVLSKLLWVCTLAFPIALIWKKKVEYWLKFPCVLAFTTIIILSFSNTFLNYLESLKPKNLNEKEAYCSGNGSQNCITEIRQRFQSTGKDIVGEQYEGDGIFQVQFIEYGRGTYNAYIRTDCDCKIAHINLTPL